MLPERKEMLIWGGIGAGALVVGWFWISSLTSDVDQSNLEIAKLRPQYETLYRPDASKLPATEALNTAKQVDKDQAEVVQQVEASLLQPYPSDMPADGSNPDAALRWVKQRYTALRGKADRMALPFPPVGSLPYEGDKALELPAPALRDALAVVLSTCTVLDYLMGLGPKRIGQIQARTPEPGPGCCAFPVLVTLSASAKVTENLLDGLRSGKARLGCSLYEVNVDGNNNNVTVQLSTILPVKEEDLERLQKTGAKPGVRPVQTPTSSRGTSRGSGR